MKNSHLGVLSCAILAGSLIVAGSNWWLVSGIIKTRSNDARSTPAGPRSGRRPEIAVMPQSKGDPYFASCRLGAEEAARELNVDLLWDGPTDMEPSKQNEVVDTWITRKVDVIAVSVANHEAISTVLRKAIAAGIRVLTWDADSEPDARDFFIDQATPEGIGTALADETARLLNGSGEFAIVTGALSATNQNDWIKAVRDRMAAKYPKLKLAVIRPTNDDRDRAFAETQVILNVYPQVKLIMGISTPAVPGSAEAIKQSGRKDVKVIGLSLPQLCKPYVHEGLIQSVVLWNTRDLGYLVVYAGNALYKKELKHGDKSFTAGRLGSIQVLGSEVILGRPFIFDRGNIDRFDF